MFKKKPVPNLSHSQQLEAVQNFASAIGDVMTVCSVSAKRKGGKLKKRFVVILKEKVAREGIERDLIFMNVKLSDARPQLCKKRFRLADICKLTANDDLSAEEFTIITSKPYVFLARSKEERDDFVCNLLHLFKEHVGKALPVDGVNLTDLKLSSDVHATADARFRRRSTFAAAMSPSSTAAASVVRSSGTLDEVTDAISAAEEEVLQNLLAPDSSVINVEEYLGKLSVDQHLLEEANVHEMLSSEELILGVVADLHALLNACDVLDHSFVDLKKQLYKNAKGQVMSLSKRNDNIDIESASYTAVIDVVRKLGQALHISDYHQEILKFGDLSDPDVVDSAIAAAEALHRNTSLPPELEPLNDVDAVVTQLSLYDELRVAVQDNLSGYITGVFKALDPAKCLQRVKQSGKLQSFSGEYHVALKHITPLLRIVVGAAPAAAEAWRKPYLAAVQPIVQACLAAAVAQAREGDKIRHECRIGHLPLWPVSGELPTLASVSQSKSIGQVTRDACKCMFSEQGLVARLFNLPPESKDILEILETVFSDAHVPIVAMCLSEAKYDTLLYVTMLYELDSLLELYKESCPCCMSFVTQINVSIKSYLSSYLEEQLTSISTQKIVIRQASVVEPLRRLPSLLRCMYAHIPSEYVSSNAGSINPTLVRIVAVASGILQDGSKTDPKYADVFLMENCMFLSKFLSRSWHLYFLQAAAQFEQQTTAARSRYCNWLVSEALEPVLAFLKTTEELLRTIPAADVQFQSACSRTVMKTIAAHFSSKKLCATAVQLAKRVRKHLCPQLKLHDAVWEMTEQVTAQVQKRFLKIVDNCYGGVAGGSVDQLDLTSAAVAAAWAAASSELHAADK